MKQDVTKEKIVSLSDASTSNISGIKHIFSDNGGFQNELKITDFEVILRNTPENLATQLLPFFYYSHLLSAHGKECIKKAWLAIFDRERHDVNGTVALGVPLSIFVVIKNITDN